jgi:hypothetical protein
MKKPKYNNEAILIHCMKREPHTLIFDKDFINYDEKTILGLCEDLETNFNYLVSLPGLTKELEITITAANSLVWAALYFHFNEIVPDKYKTDD